MDQQPKRQSTSFARVIVTPIILLVAGYLVGGFFDAVVPGVALAAVIGIVYILWASRR